MHRQSLFNLLTAVAFLALFAPSIQAQSWSVITDHNPNPRLSGTVEEIDGKFYVLGGLKPNTSLEENRIDLFDPSSVSWKTLQPTTSVTPGFGGMTWSYDGKIYSYRKQSVYVYDPALNQWELPILSGEEPTISTTLNPVVAGSRVYFIGAGASGENYDINYLELNDLTWGKITTTGDQAAGGQSFGWSQNSRLYVFQGVATERTSDVSILDLQTNIWSRHPTGSELLYFNSAAEYEGKVILLAHTGQEGQTLKTLIFDPQNNSLKELALQRQIAHAYSRGLFNLGGVLYSVGSVLKNNGSSASDSVSIEALRIPNSYVASGESLRISVHPNPASTTLHLNATGRVSWIEIVDIVGRRMISEIGDPTIDVSMLPAGIYRLRCEVDGRWISHSFVKR